MRFLCFLTLFLYALPVMAEEKLIRIYQDADLSHHSESSRAIQLGIKTALSEVDHTIAGHRVEYVYLNHRGNVVRSKLNYQKFLADDKALVIYSGIHSPPLIKNRNFINEKSALTFVPWAAGGPITRYPSKKNWVFRLSVDDRRAGPVIINFAMKYKKCKRPHLLLEDTPWGDSNLTSMTSALAQQNYNKPEVTRFSWNVKDQGARLILREIIKLGTDCIILVANAVEGVNIVRALIDVKGNEDVKLISHWGITGGNFHEKIPSNQRKKIDLTFIQTCFSFTNKEQSDFSRSVFSRLTKVSGGKIKRASDLASAAGFIHAYDLTKLLIAGVRQAGLTGNITTDRNNLRLALENLKKPIRGLVKTYQQPFSVFDEVTNINAHEALHAENYCMGKYGSNDEILIIGAY